MVGVERRSEDYTGLLRAIIRHDPASIRETARLVNRDVRQVHRILAELEALHLFELVEGG